MISEIHELRVLHAVVKHGSYAKAAEELALTPSGVSRVISRLEERLDVRLLQRTTRKLSLTEAGAAFHGRTLQVLADLEDAEADVQKAVRAPRGTLRVSAPVVFGRLFIAPMFHALARQFPDLSIDLKLMDRFVDLVDEGIDLAIRIGQLADSRLIARRLCVNHRVLVASPDYIARRGMPAEPEALRDHECILFTGFVRPREWKLVGPRGPEAFPVSGRLASNNIDVLTTSALQGLGISVGPTMSVGPYLLNGQLVRVLPDYELEHTAVFAVYPSARQLSSKVRAMVDFLVTNLADPPVWDRPLIGKVPGFEAPVLRTSESA